MGFDFTPEDTFSRPTDQQDDAQMRRIVREELDLVLADMQDVVLGNPAAHARNELLRRMGAQG